MKSEGRIRVGISGWRYKPWRDSFYPPDLVQRKELEFASSKLRTIEINGTFYSLQRPESFQTWYDSTPDDFVFSVKGSRFITHMKKLKDVETPLASFLAQGLLRLGKKLGPILWQFPPNFRYEPERLEAFFAMLPKTRSEASELAARHDALMNGRSWLKVEQDGRMRHAIEIRHESFVCEEFVQLLRKYDISLVKADTVEWPLLMDVTSDFVYCRLHGSEELYVSGYSDESLAVWAKRVKSWAGGGEVADGRLASTRQGAKRKTRDVFVYFDNDVKVHAPFNAQDLQKRVDLVSD